MIESQVANKLSWKVNTNPEIIDIEDDHPIARRAASDTWQIKFNEITSFNGYSLNKTIIKALPIKEWLNITNSCADNPASMVIDATLIYSSVMQLSKFLQFSKLKDAEWLADPIEYFAMYDSDKNEAHKLFTTLHKLGGFNLTTIKTNSSSNYKTAKNLNIFLHMMVQMTAHYYRYKPKNLIFVTGDNQILPLVDFFRKQTEVVTTVAISRSKPVSNYFLNRFDHIIDVIDMLEHIKALSDYNRPIKVTTHGEMV